MTASADPLRDQSIQLPDARRIQCAEWGSLDGKPVIFLPGTPSSRLICPNVEATVDAGVRLITIDRPGYGRSDPFPGLSARSVADDLATVHRLLRLPSCAVVGWSGGTAYALAFAALHPGLVSAVDIAAGCGPLGDVPRPPDADDENDWLLALATKDRSAAIAALRQRYAWYEEDPEGVLGGAPREADPDSVTLADPNIAAVLRACLREGARQGTTGLVDDWLATRPGPWGFPLESISVTARLWWGDRDGICGREHVDWLASRIPDSTVVVWPGEGHLGLIRHWSEILTTGQ